MKYQLNASRFFLMKHSHECKLQLASPIDFFILENYLSKRRSSYVMLLVAKPRCMLVYVLYGLICIFFSAEVQSASLVLLIFLTFAWETGFDSRVDQIDANFHQCNLEQCTSCQSHSSSAYSLHLNSIKGNVKTNLILF